MNIGEQKANIGTRKANIEDRFTHKTATHVQKLPAAFGSRSVFGRSDVHTWIEADEKLRAASRDGRVRSSRCPDAGKKYRFRQEEG